MHHKLAIHMVNALSKSLHITLTIWTAYSTQQKSAKHFYATQWRMQLALTKNWNADEYE